MAAAPHVRFAVTRHVRLAAYDPDEGVARFLAELDAHTTEPAPVVLPLRPDGARLLRAGFPTL